jgi:hypothetical protein
MDGHLVPVSSNSMIRGSLESFTSDAERWLAALHWCMRTSDGDDAATVRQDAGCKSLKNGSKDQATSRNQQESLRQQSLSSYLSWCRQAKSLIGPEAAMLPPSD